MVRRGPTVNVTEPRVVAYDVVYDCPGWHFGTRLNQDPGAPGNLLPVNVTVAGATNNTDYNDDGTQKPMQVGSVTCISSH